MSTQNGKRRTTIVILVVSLAAIILIGAGVATASVLLAPSEPVKPTAAPPKPSKKPSPSPSPTPSPTPSLDAYKPEPLVGGGSDAMRTVPGNNIALTIDDGPDPRYTPDVLDLLDRLKIKAVFCMIGENVKGHENLVREMVKRGHTLCNHTTHHDISLRLKSGAKIRDDMRTTTNLIVKASGGVYPKYFRAPGGNWSHRVLLASRQLGMTPLHWSVDPNDWKKPGADSITSTMRGAGAGDMILCHDGGGEREQTVRALKRALPSLQSRGLGFVIPPMERTKAEAAKDPSPAPSSAGPTGKPSASAKPR